ncbi:DnaD domain protein [Streptococcus entericus]|uniref:DnaD domain protein n=1 Tax=Streptococcus entericus TaxID=155680 RepID=UPI0003777139|nr:DnaD domain protein [Streptococcus entericus]
MKPNDTFSYLKNNCVYPDQASLLQLYQPLMGADAYLVYNYLVHFFDNGRALHPFTELLNHLQFGFDRLRTAFDKLGALGLIKFYQHHQTYLIKLNSPLDRESFLNNAVYRSLLSSYIGEVAVEDLQMALPVEAVDQTKRFSEVFSDRGEVYHHPKQADINFDLEHFKQLMRRDGLYFDNEQTDVLGLYHFAEENGLTWFDTYQLAKATAVKGQLSLVRLRAKQEQQEQPSQSTGLTREEQAALKTAQNHVPEVYLSTLKKMRKAMVTDQERQLLRELAQMGFLDDVINLMVLYTLQRTKSANLNKVYLMKIANDFSYKGIKTGEQALLYWQQKPQSSAKPKAGSNHQTNVPSWSHQDYKTESSQEEQEQLEELKRQMLGQSGREE